MTLLAVTNFYHLLLIAWSIDGFTTTPLFSRPIKSLSHVLSHPSNLMQRPAPQQLQPRHSISSSLALKRVTTAMYEDDADDSLKGTEGDGGKDKEEDENELGWLQARDKFFYEQRLSDTEGDVNKITSAERSQETKNMAEIVTPLMSSSSINNSRNWRKKKQRRKERVVNHNEHAGRRGFLGRTFGTATAITTGGLFGVTPRPAYAKGKEPVTAEVVDDAFLAIERELDPSVPFETMGKGGGVAFLEQLVQDEKWDEIKEFTKFYDLSLRKMKIGKARKLMTDSKMKDRAIMLSNAVTFDLIGINRASRVGNVEEAMKYVGELKNDVNSFLGMKGQIIVAN